MRLPARFTAMVATAATSTLLLGGCTASPAEESASAENASTAHHVAYLWAVGAEDASLVASDDAMFLELDGIEKVITRFSDRPEREASQVDLRDFLGRWDGRFAEVPPNAVLSYQAEPGAAPIEVVVEISRPRYHRATGKLVFAAELIEFTPDKLEGAEHPVEAPKATLPAHTGPVSIFIDSEGPDVTVRQIEMLSRAAAMRASAIDNFKASVMSGSMQIAGGASQILAMTSHLQRISATNYSVEELTSALTESRSAADRARSYGEASALLVSDSTMGILSAHGITLPNRPTTEESNAAINATLSRIADLTDLQQMDVAAIQDLLIRTNNEYRKFARVMINQG